MKKTDQETTGIVTFNDKVLDLPTLIELDEMDLEQVSGGGNRRDLETECWIDCWINYVDPD